MKNKISLLLLLLSSLTLSACSDSGFSVIRTTNKDNPEDNRGEREEENNVGVDSGGSSVGYDDGNKENVEPPSDNPGAEVVTGNQDDNKIAIDASDKIAMFKFSFINIDENKLVHVTFDSDPLETKFDYSYYTVNGYKLENQVLEKEEGETPIYKINLDSVDSGKYTIKFFNQSNKQYGVAYIDITTEVVSTSYIAMAIGVAQIQFATIGYNIMRSMQKIGDFFSWLFTGDTSSGMTFGD